MREHSTPDNTALEQSGVWGCVRKKYPPPPMASNIDTFSLSLAANEVMDEVITEETMGVPRPIMQNASVLYFVSTTSNETLQYVPVDFRPYLKLIG